jgi:hypothetical protein
VRYPPWERYHHQRRFLLESTFDLELGQSVRCAQKKFAVLESLTGGKLGLLDPALPSAALKNRKRD